MFTPSTVLLAAAPAPEVTVSITVLLVAIGIVLCVFVGHRWSTLLLGVLIGLYLTGGFAQTTKDTVTTVITSTARGLSDAAR